MIPLAGQVSRSGAPWDTHRFSVPLRMVCPGIVALSDGCPESRNRAPCLGALTKQCVSRNRRCGIALPFKLRACPDLRPRESPVDWSVFCHSSVRAAQGVAAGSNVALATVVDEMGAKLRILAICSPRISTRASCRVVASEMPETSY
jgi:hypothetical protein